MPTNNAGVLRAVLEAISGNPDAYLRYGAPPTLYHNAAGANGTIFDRSMLANATEYANWVPLDGKLESHLKPGLWYIAVRAAGNANARYRLKLSIGNIVDLPLHGPAITGQLLAGGDWRYYRFTAPTTLPGGFDLTFSEQSGDVVVHLRDTIPPGNGNTGSAAEFKDWDDDDKNRGDYQSYNTPGTFPFNVPPVRPGATYYFGVRAVNDSVFTIRSTTNGLPNHDLPLVDFYGGTVETNLPPGSQAIYRVDVPVTASNVGMSKQPGEPNHAGNPGGKSIWWRWTAPASGEVTLTTAGTPFNTLLAVYTGQNVSNLTLIASDNDSGGVTNRSVVQFNAVAGVTYQIAVDGYNAASSRINLGLSMGDAPGGGSQPRLVSLIRSTNGRTEIRITAEPNRGYIIESTADFIFWSQRGSVTTDATGAGTFVDLATPTRTFYRTRQ